MKTEEREIQSKRGKRERDTQLEGKRERDMQ